MKIDLVLIDLSYKVFQKLEHLASLYGLFGEENIAEIVDMYGEYLKLGGLPLKVCSMV